MASFPSPEYILKRHNSYIEKQKRSEEIRVKREWYKIPKDCRDRLLKEIRNAMHDISKSITTSQTIDFHFSLTDLGFSYPLDRNIITISEEAIYYFIRSFNSRMCMKDKTNKDVKFYWHIQIINQNFKEFLKHPSAQPLKLLLTIEQYKDKGLSNENKL